MSLSLIGATIFVAAIQTSTPVVGPPSVALWGPLRSGMTKEQVKAVQPKSKISISEQCSAWLYYTYENKILKEVKLSSAKTSADCTLLTEKTLLTKYGTRPLRSTQYATGDCGGSGTVSNLCRALGGDKTVKYTTAEWESGGVRIAFSYTDQDDGWNVEYTVEPQVTADTVHSF